MNLLLRTASQIVNPLDSRRRFGFGSGVTGGAFVGPLDAYSTSLVGAWSVSRRLLATYTGPLVRVRRSSDSTEQDIGATATGDLDTTALLAFCGAGNGFVRTLYAQTGSGIDFGMSTAASQPLIVSSGSLETLNSKPTMRVTGGQCLDSAFAGGGAAAMTVYSAGATAANASGMLFARYLSFGTTGVNDYQSVNRWVPFLRNINTTTYYEFFNGTATSPTALADGSNFVIASRIQSANPVRYLRINGGTAVTENTASTPNLTFNLSRWFRGISSSDGAELWAGKGSELVIYNTAHSDPTTIQGVLNSYFGAY